MSHVERTLMREENVTPLWFIMLILIYKTRKANVSHADGANEESLVESEKKVVIDQ